jgi:hypothetical protein
MLEGLRIRLKGVVLMKLAFGGAVVVLAGTMVWFAAAAEPGRPAPAPPPLKVDKSAPLLLLDEPAVAPDPADPKKPRADNSACFVCHGNFQDEKMVTAHAKENIGCVKCHGPSLAHRNDEDNVTAPDKMFPAQRIDSSCRKCHDDHIAPPRKIIAMFLERCPRGTDPKKVVCTDCHGEHRLKVRSVLWDKELGKLLKSDPKSAEKSGVTWKKPASEKH